MSTEDVVGCAESYDRPKKDARRRKAVPKDQPMQCFRREKGCPTVMPHLRYCVGADRPQINSIRNPVGTQLARGGAADCARTCRGVSDGPLDVRAESPPSGKGRISHASYRPPGSTESIDCVDPAGHR